MVRAAAFFVLVGAVSVAVGIGWSQYYWRYPVAPPPLLAELGSVRTVQQISAISELDPTSNEAIKIELLDQAVLQSPSSWLLDPTWRFPLKLQDDGIDFEDARPLTAELANALWHAANETGLLIEGTAGYPDTKTLYGHMGVGRLADGREVAFATVAGYEYSNDHYPYYEFVARLNNGKPEIIDSQSFYFDVAGIEGMTWFSLAVFCFIVVVPVVGIPLMLVMRAPVKGTI